LVQRPHQQERCGGPDDHDDHEQQCVHSKAKGCSTR
jgi:hypothetical protein